MRLKETIRGVFKKICWFLLGFDFYHCFGKLNWEEHVLANPEFTIDIILLKFPIINIELNIEGEYFYFGLLGFGIQYSWQ